ncbi:MAG TPA: hypothetical protein VF629_12920 [Hymenobacter sp.]|uniref:hypothetical protein n=1 Tax=Hymenobacter sp. TaxID=1898978 RepID=UPI002ED9FEAE
MSKVYTFAAIVLFWVTLSTSLLRVQLVSSPVYKMRVPTHRSMLISTPVAVQTKAAATFSYN